MFSEIPLLQNVRVASPCSAQWDEMTPVEGNRVRFCDHCEKRVYNLSSMGQAEAEGLLRAHEGRLCVRYFRRDDGTILTNDCPIGLRAAQRLLYKRQRTALAAFLILAAGFAGYAAERGFSAANQDVQNVEQAPLTGQLALPPSDVVGGLPAPVAVEPRPRADIGMVINWTSPPQHRMGKVMIHKEKRQDKK